MPHADVLAHISQLGFQGVDLGLFGNRSHLRPEIIRLDVAAWVERTREQLHRLNLGVADVFLVPWTDMHRLATNHPDARERSEARELFTAILGFAAGIGALGMTLNSGFAFEGESARASLRRSSSELSWRIDLASRRNIQVRIEASVGSITDTPTKALELLDLTPGLRLTVDYSHFEFQGIPISDVEPLLDYAGHVQCRGAAPGRMQVPFQENTIDYGVVVEGLRRRAYSGYISTEYVWMRQWDCWRTENTMETIQFRDFIRAALDGVSYQPVEMAT